MTTLKIQHADPQSGKTIAFDILRSSRNPDGKPADAPEGAAVLGRSVNDQEDVRETFTLEPGHFKLVELSGDLVLREVSPAVLAERERVASEDEQLKAEVERDRLAKVEAERVERMTADRAERKAKIEAEAAKSQEGKPQEGNPAADQIAGVRINTERAAQRRAQDDLTAGVSVNPRGAGPVEPAVPARAMPPVNPKNR